VNALALRLAIEEAGGSIARDGAELVVRTPHGALTPELVAALRRHKSELLALSEAGPPGASTAAWAASPGDLRAAAGWDVRAWWYHYQERAGILEHEGGLPRRESERRAFRECVGFWLWSHPPDPCPPDRCACCGHAIPPRGEGAVPLLRVIGPQPNHLWVHERCLERFREEREAQARSYFAACGLREPAP
jgi:hypothetical protein